VKSVVLMQTQSGVVAGTVRKKKRRYGPKPRVPYDKRYALARRVKALAIVFRERLGAEAADPIVAAAIARCAETTALSEVARAKALRGEDVNPETVLRLTRTADLLTRQLGLSRRSGHGAAFPS
jgi:hypothetical protein